MSLFEEKILLYRGIRQPNIKGRAGKWWTTNPYYALRYADDGAYPMFVAFISRRELNNSAKDVSTEEDYQHYFFGNRDPPRMRRVTKTEIEKLRSHIIYRKAIIGGVMARWPKNPIAIGKRIFRA